MNFTVLDDGHINSPPLQFAGRYPGSIMTASLGPECAEIRRRVRENSLLVGDSVVPAAPLEVIIPPMPTPPTINGKQITYAVRVDSSGAAIDSTITLTEFKPASYRKQMLSTFKATTYRPAILQGCGVEGPASVTFTSSTVPSR